VLALVAVYKNRVVAVVQKQLESVCDHILWNVNKGFFVPRETSLQKFNVIGCVKGRQPLWYGLGHERENGAQLEFFQEWKIFLCRKRRTVDAWCGSGWGRDGGGWVADGK